MYSSSLSDLKKTTEVVESLFNTSTRCSVPEITSLLQEAIPGFNVKNTLDKRGCKTLVQRERSGRSGIGYKEESRRGLAELH